MLIPVDILDKDGKQFILGDYVTELPLSCFYKILDTDDLVVEKVSGHDLVKIINSGVVIENITVIESTLFYDSDGSFNFRPIYKYSYKVTDSSLIEKASFSRFVGGATEYVVRFRNGKSIRLSLNAYGELMSNNVRLYDLHNYGICFIEYGGFKAVNLNLSYIHRYKNYYIAEVSLVCSVRKNFPVWISIVYDLDCNFVDSVFVTKEMEYDYNIKQLFEVNDRVLHSKLLYMASGRV